MLQSSKHTKNLNLLPQTYVYNYVIFYRFKTKPNAFKVRVGEWDAKRRKERLQFQEREVSSIIIHDEYDEDVLFYDAAALILSKPVNFDQHIGTICLPQQGQKIQSRNCYANGWGKNVFGKQKVIKSIIYNNNILF